MRENYRSPYEPDINKQIVAWWVPATQTAWKFKGRAYFDLDDLRQEGLISVWEALVKGKPPSRMMMLQAMRRWLNEQDEALPGPTVPYLDELDPALAKTGRATSEPDIDMEGWVEALATGEMDIKSVSPYVHRDSTPDPQQRQKRSEEDKEAGAKVWTYDSSKGDWRHRPPGW